MSLFPSSRTAHSLTLATLFSTLMLGATGVYAAAGNPLPRCALNSQSFYLARYAETGTSNAYPAVTLERITLNTDNTVSVSAVWSGEGAPLPPPEDTAAAGRTAGATVAMGMNSANGYIYAIRAVGNDPAFPGPWQGITSRIQVLKYGAGGVDNLGVIQNMPADAIQQLGPNYNAADFNPATGELIIANFQTGGSLSRLIRVSVAADVPTYLGTITLSSNIPGTQSGDFAIDATGTYAYGIAKATGTFGTSTAYRIELSTGTVSSLAAIGGFDTFTPFGGGATLQNGSMAFYVGGTGGIRLLSTAGALTGSYTTATGESADAAACLPALPEVTLVCSPTSLVDAADNVSTCTLTSDQPAPAGGLSVAIAPPTSNPRYGTTCASPVVIAEGETTATCTITATPNTTPGDGSVTASIALIATPARYTLGAPSEASIIVDNDDSPPVIDTTALPVPTMNGLFSLLVLVGLMFCGFAAKCYRRTPRH